LEFEKKNGGTVKKKKYWDAGRNSLIFCNFHFTEIMYRVVTRAIKPWPDPTQEAIQKICLARSISF